MAETKTILSNSIAKQLGFEDYLMVVDNLHKTDISGNEQSAGKFRKAFKTYFRVRRNDAWCDNFFSVFQQNKDISVTLDDTAVKEFSRILEEIHAKNKKHGLKWRVEASFVSKMLSVINTDLPIYDSEVVDKLGLPSLSGDDDKRLATAKANYKAIVEKYKNYLETEDAKKAIKLFDDFFPSYAGKFSATKKIDHFLWSMDKNELRDIGCFNELIGE